MSHIVLSFFFISFANKLGDTEIALISSALEVNSSLTRLDLDMVVKFGKTFFCFHFTANKIGPAGASSISSMLKVNSTLTEINIRMM